MHCPFCRHPDSRVVDSRETDEGQAIRRRRSCPECGRRFTTVETAVLAVVKRSGVTEPFSREKVIKGVRRACQGRQVDDDALNLLAQQVEDTVRATGSPEVPSHEVGLAILGPLRELDEVAYLRFASVYRSFSSAEDFEREIEALRAHREVARAELSVGRVSRSASSRRSTTRPATRTQPSGLHSGMDHRTLALHDGQVAAEVVGDAHRRGAGGLVLGHAEIGCEHPRPHLAALAVGPRPQVVLDVVGVVVRVGGEELVGRRQVVDGELRRPVRAGADRGAGRRRRRPARCPRAPAACGPGCHGRVATTTRPPSDARRTAARSPG